LNAGVWFRRGRLVIFTLLLRGDTRRFQAQIPLITLFKIPRPALRAPVPIAHATFLGRGSSLTTDARVYLHEAHDKPGFAVHSDFDQPIFFPPHRNIFNHTVSGEMATAKSSAPQNPDERA
jgi:hypothetical protein